MWNENEAHRRQRREHVTPPGGGVMHNPRHCRSEHLKEEEEEEHYKNKERRDHLEQESFLFSPNGPKQLLSAENKMQDFCFWS